MAEQLAGETKGAPPPSTRQMGLRGDQAKCPFLPLLLPVAAPRAHRAPPAAARERSGASETFNFVLMSSGGVPGRAPGMAHLSVRALYRGAVVPPRKSIPNNGDLRALSTRP